MCSIPTIQHQDRTYKSKVSSQDSHLLVEVSDKGVLVIQPPKLKLWPQILHLGLYRDPRFKPVESLSQSFPSAPVS